MKRRHSRTTRLWLLVLPVILLPFLANAQSSENNDSNNPEALAITLQNPLGKRDSVAFQNAANFDTGPQKGTLDVFTIQPAIPIRINADWTLITRTVLPIVSQPGFAPGKDSTQGLGATQISFYLSPARLFYNTIVAAGPIVQIPTTTDKVLGSERWGAGPAVAALNISGPWVVGVLANNIWTVGPDSISSRNLLTLQPVLNYNFTTGTFLTSTPMIRVNWLGTGNRRWLVPLGGGVGQIFKVGHQPLNAQLAAYYNVVRPNIGPVWQLRFQIQFLFAR